MSKLSLRSGRKKFQPICRCRIKLWALYWVATAIRRMPEFTAFESAKSMMRDFPPKYTAGLARRSVNSIRRLPRPPASTKARACRARGSCRSARIWSSPTTLDRTRAVLLVAAPGAKNRRILGFSQAVVAIARDDKLVRYKGYGRLDSTKDTPVPLDAVFALA